MHPYDRLFFDPDQDNYTVQRWLDDVNARYGGVDSILMWPTYTNIGTDDRSQFDLFEAMPGGIAGVRRAVDELHAAGVKVLIPYNPCAIPRSRCAGCSGSGYSGSGPALAPAPHAAAGRGRGDAALRSGHGDVRRQRQPHRRDRQERQLLRRSACAKILLDLGCVCSDDLEKCPCGQDRQPPPRRVSAMRRSWIR